LKRIVCSPNEGVDMESDMMENVPNVSSLSNDPLWSVIDDVIDMVGVWFCWNKSIEVFRFNFFTLDHVEFIL
jgi:hypothetical protein